MAIPAAPKHLSAEAKRWWKRIIEECDGLEDSQLWILQGGLEQWDTAQRIREVIAKDGESVVDRWGQIKPHPLLAPFRDAQSGVRQTFKMLNLDLEAE